MKKTQKNIWLLVVVMLMGLFTTEAVHAYQTAYLTTYQSDYYYGGSFVRAGARQGANFAWNGTLQVKKASGWTVSGIYQVYATAYSYPNAWRN